MKKKDSDDEMPKPMRKREKKTQEKASEQHQLQTQIQFQPKSPRLTELPKKKNMSKGRKTIWSEEEHNQFIKAVRLHGKDWKKISEQFTTKDLTQIRSHAQHFRSIVKKNPNFKDNDVLAILEPGKKDEAVPENQVVPMQNV